MKFGGKAQPQGLNGLWEKVCFRQERAFSPVFRVARASHPPDCADDTVFATTFSRKRGTARRRGIARALQALQVCQ